VEAVVGALDHVEPRARELLADRREEREVGERVARALEQEHRLRDARQVLRALDAGLPGGMEREAEEHEAAHRREPALGGGV
jgi:hypothetical protein